MLLCICYVTKLIYIGDTLFYFEPYAFLISFICHIGSTEPPLPPQKWQRTFWHLKLTPISALFYRPPFLYRSRHHRQISYAGSSWCELSNKWSHDIFEAIPCALDPKKYEDETLSSSAYGNTFTRTRPSRPIRSEGVKIIHNPLHRRHKCYSYM